MQKSLEFACIGCPLGCRVKLTVDERGDITDMTGHRCKEGKKYAESEYRNPVRVLTATVLTEGSTIRLLPVRTNKPILKGRLIEAMRVLADMRVKPPVKRGQAIVSNILNTGTDLVATNELTV